MPCWPRKTVDQPPDRLGTAFAKRSMMFWIKARLAGVLLAGVC